MRWADHVLTFVATIVARLPWRRLALLGAMLGWFAGRVLRIRRAHVLASMRRAGLEAPEDAANAMYRGLGTGVFELLWLSAASERRVQEALFSVRFDPVLLRELREALARGPVVLGVSHSGNWELVAFAASRLLAGQGEGEGEVRRLAVVAKPLSVAGIHAFCNRLRARFGVRVLAPVGALSSAKQALKEGSVVVMPLDQVPERARHGVRLPFLGGPAFVDRAPATLARISDATLLVVGVERTNEGHRVRGLASFSTRDDDRHDPATGRLRFVTRTTQDANTALERFLRAHPGSWMWLHRRWRAPALAKRTKLVATSHTG